VQAEEPADWHRRYACRVMSLTVQPRTSWLMGQMTKSNDLESGVNGSARAVDELVGKRDSTRIAEMFNHISRRYDLMNRVMTLGQDGHWRRLTARAAKLRQGDRALDVATGTGDMARELARSVGPNGSVVAIDIADAMLKLAHVKTAGLPVHYLHCDAQDMSFDNEFDAAVVAFGLRNFSDRRMGIRSMAAALKPGGRLVILELVPSRGRLKPLIEIYEKRFIPILGRFVTRDVGAYTYLPQSVAASVTTGEIEHLLREVGITGVKARELNFGTVAIVSGIK
jgi:demethylmenaquinone methyltransferase / 2-methoxy-6-polyprenyl-1,4-benzoquinol methylase